MMAVGSRLGTLRITTTRNRLEVARLTRVVAECVAELLDAGGQSRVADGSVGPYEIEELLLGDDASGTLSEHGEDGERFWREMHLVRAAREALGWIQAKTAKSNHAGAPTRSQRNPGSLPLLPTVLTRIVNPESIAMQGADDRLVNTKEWSAQ